MTIGLIDVDGRSKSSAGKGRFDRFPNLPLMKLSAWHKANGDSVEWCFPMKKYDRVYASKVFTFTPDIDFVPQTDDFRKGGTGYFYPTGGDPLPYDIEHMRPDYSLYGITDTAFGFMSRGCPRGCDFCIVAKKEGRASRKVADVREWWDGQKHIELMDPNTLACPDWRDILGQLEDTKARVDFNQGLDIRMLTEEKAEIIMRMKPSYLHFAWDRHQDDLEPVFRRMAEPLHWALRRKRILVYVLVNYGSTMENNLHRIYTLRELGYEPYVMIYDKKHAPSEVKRLASWTNNRVVFAKCKRFEDFKKHASPPVDDSGLPLFDAQ